MFGPIRIGKEEWEWLGSLVSSGIVQTRQQGIKLCISLVRDYFTNDTLVAESNVRGPFDNRFKKKGGD